MVCSFYFFYSGFTVTNHASSHWCWAFEFFRGYLTNLGGLTRSPQLQKSCTRFHFFQDFRFQNHRIRNVFDHVIFNIRSYTKVYSKEFAIRSHTKLCDDFTFLLQLYGE